MTTIADTLALALQHHKAGRLPEAETLYRQILQVRPDHPDSLHLLGVIAHQAGKHEVAVAYITRAIALNPDSPGFHNNIGEAYRAQGRLEEAAVHYRKALALKPACAEAYNNLGNALQAQGKSEEAVACYRQALALRSAYPEAYNNLGNAVQAQGKLKEAVACYRQALALRSAYPEAHNNLGNALQEQGKLEEAVESYHRALALNWDNPMVPANLLFAYTCQRADAAAVADGYREWNDRYARPLASQIKPHNNDRNPARRLRVGYVSADFREHPISYFVEPLLAAHDHDQVEVFCYVNGTRSDGLTKRLKASADVWRDVGGLSDAAMAECVSSDRIDILVDLSGHTVGNRLLVFARKPAPVQVTYLGSLTTTGLSSIDYKLTDRYLTPPRTPEWFSEKLIRLPACFACYRPREGAPVVTPLPATADGQVTFGSFNNLVKVTPDVIALWSSILRRLPKARLILRSKTLTDPEQCTRYKELFMTHGIEGGRVELHPWSTVPDFLALYGRVDIALDPFPYNGCTTTCEALWMGVPVVTLAGSMSYGRFGVSLLSTLGLEELVATTPEEYVKIAVGLAKKRKRLAALRKDLRSRMAASALCDAKTFAHEVEDAYRRMWRRWCKSAAEI